MSVLLEHTGFGVRKKKSSDEEDTESVDGSEESVEGDEDVPHSIPDTVEVAVPREAQS